MRVYLWVVLGGLAVAAPARGQSEPFFLPLGDLPSGEIESFASAISADGTTVVGGSSVRLPGNKVDTSQAFRWTRDTGMLSLGTMGGYTGSSNAAGVSADGSVIVGSIQESAATDSPKHAFVWTAELGMRELELLPGTSSGSAAGVSGDGTIIVGWCVMRLDAIAVRWVNGQVEALGGLNTSAKAISADGTTIVGYGGGEAFRWRAETGMVLLGDLPGRADFSFATCVSGDGSVVAGYSDSDRSPGCCIYEVFRWDQERGIHGLGFVGWPLALSGDGRTLGGSWYASSDGEGGAVLIEPGYPARTFRRVLAGHRVGPEIFDYSFVQVSGMTPDGKTFVGFVSDHERHYQAFIASIGPYCLLDWDRSGTLTSQDFFEFLHSFFAGDADYNGNGVTDAWDFSEFLQDWRFEDCE